MPMVLVKSGSQIMAFMLPISFLPGRQMEQKSPLPRIAMTTGKFT